MFRRVGSVLLVGCCAIGSSALPAAAGSVKCGDKISADIVLTKNLKCSGDALHIVVSTENTVRINLNGYSIKGDGTGTAFETVLFRPSGSQISGKLVVTGGTGGKVGTVTGFASVFIGANPSGGGVGLQNLTFTNLRLKSNTNWMYGRAMDDVVVKNTNFIDTGNGGAYTDGGTVTVRNSKFVRSGISSASESYGYLYKNTFIEGGFAGGYASTVVATGNSFQDCDKGISMNLAWHEPMKVDGNKFERCRIGLELNGLTGPVSVKGNSFVENTQIAMSFSSLAHQDLTIANNKFLRNVGDGLTGTGAGPTRVTGNLAVGNGALGLNTPGVTDGGRNVARDNGDPNQCVGVACSPH
jgi:hypothetical protein